MAKQVVDISVTELQSNPLQPRGIVTPESLVELVDSIKEHGVLEPLIVAKTPAGYQIIAGERRWRAAKMAGLSTVPAVIKETSPRGMLEMALVENVQREDLNPLDRAKAFIRLIEEFGLTNKEIAKRISKSAAYISNSIKLLSLPDALKDGLLSGLITEGHARALASIDDTKLMIEAYKIILRESGSVRKAEEIARRMKKRAKQPPRGLDRISPLIISEESDKIRDEIHTALGGGEDIIIRLTRSRAQTKVFITLKGNLKKTEDNLIKIYRGITKKEKS